MPQPFEFWKQSLNPITLGERVALDLIAMTWTPAPPDSDGWDRGDYLTRIVGTDFHIDPPMGWQSMEIATLKAQSAYRVIANAIDRAAKANGP